MLLKTTREDNRAIHWPSGESKPLLATSKLPSELVAKLGVEIFQDRDDLDWYEAAIIEVVNLGPVLIIRHKNNPQGLTAVYVDKELASDIAENQLCKLLGLAENEISWRP